MSGLRVVIIHYHLKRGGVTRVIESTIDGLKASHGEDINCVVLAGEVPSGFKHIEKAIQIDGLQYSNLQDHTPDPKVLLDEIRAAANGYFGGEPDLWHIHNHSLGKNRSMPGVIALLVQSGASVLLHMHDFAEDGRPENYRLNKELPDYANALYPDADNAHYGFINSRDREIFLRNKIPPERLHYLGNPVGSPMKASLSADTQSIRDELGAERLFLYPVRAVRRKNFGEVLFWAALAAEGDIFATTLGPTNPDYMPQYSQWKQFSDDLGLPMRFSIGESGDWDFPDIINAADYILTTSIAEGFGLTFLEPFLFGKSILGRNLPEVTIDFADTGLPIRHLYTQLAIPADWVDADALAREIRSSLLTTYNAYATVPPADFVEQAIAAITTANGSIDFGGLNESMQQSVIRRIVEDPDSRQQLALDPLVPDQPPALSSIKLDGFSFAAYAERIFNTYQSLTASPKGFLGYFSCDKILQEYLKPSRFRLLRT